MPTESQSRRAKSPAETDFRHCANLTKFFERGSRKALPWAIALKITTKRGWLPALRNEAVFGVPGF